MRVCFLPVGSEWSPASIDVNENVNLKAIEIAAIVSGHLNTTEVVPLVVKAYYEHDFWLHEKFDSQEEGEEYDKRHVFLVLSSSSDNLPDIFEMGREADLAQVQKTLEDAGLKATDEYFGMIFRAYGEWAPTSDS